jgi:hypothetical protein
MSVLTTTAISIARRFGVGGASWIITREDSSGDTQTIGTATPLYVKQRKLSTIERALAQSAATPRAEWSAIWADDLTPALESGDTITSSADSSLAFLVTSLSETDRVGAIVATLEKKPYV